MAFDGSGVFLRLRNWVADATAGVKIRADFHDTEDNNFADGLSHCIVKDGQTTITQNIPWNSKRITALADPIDPQDAATKDYADSKMPLDGSAPFTGDVTITKNNPSLTLNDTDAAGAIIHGQRNGKDRWVIRLINGETETGGNTGSNMDFLRYADDGSYLDQAMIFNRATGRVLVGKDPSAPLGIATKQYTDTKLPLAGGTITGNLSVVGPAAFSTSINSPGTNSFGPTTTGGLTNNGSLANNGVMSSTGTITCGSVMNAAGGVMVYNGDFGFSDAGYARVFRYTTQWRWEFNSATGSLAWVNASGTITQFRFDGALVHSFNAYKPGGGPWADASDARIKTVLGDYSSGLAAVTALNPVRYSFKGNDTADPDGQSPHQDAASKGTEFIGLIAQDTAVPMPELVTTQAGYIDGAAVDDLHMLDTTPLVYALVNAIKELKARVEALEAGSTR